MLMGCKISSQLPIPSLIVAPARGIWPLADNWHACLNLHQMLGSVAQKRLEEKEAALAETTRLKREHDELAQRLVDMQMEMVERKHAVRCCFGSCFCRKLLPA